MPKEMNNPAARLSILVKKVRETAPNQQIRSAWAKVLGVSEADSYAILLGIFDVTQLVIETRHAIESLEGYQHDLYLPHIDKIFSALCTHNELGRAWGTVVEQINDKDEYALEVCSDILSKYSQEKPIENDNIEKILNDVEALEQEILKSDLPQALKLFLSEQLEKLRAALLRYRLFGIKRLKSALESIAGATYFEKEKISPSWDHPMISKFWGLLAQVSDLITLTQGFPMLPQGIQMLLGSGKS